jgi:predicted metal-binding protein
VATDEQNGRSRKRLLVVTLILIPLALVLMFSLYLANTAGELPWQTDPTRIPVTPFANLPTVESSATP